MIVKMSSGASDKEIDKIIANLSLRGFQVQPLQGGKSVFAVFGEGTHILIDEISAYEYVDSVIRIQQPYKKASRLFKESSTQLSIGNIKIGDPYFSVIAGPCSVESSEQMDIIAVGIKAAGSGMLRGGAFKPRSSPYTFQGLALEGLALLKEQRKKTGLPIVSEIMSTKHLEQFVDEVDIIQVGARNMQNFELLKALGETRKPILLKRGLSATIEEWLMSAEYILAGGNDSVILCERGIRTFETSMRNTLDISAIAMVKKLSHLPIIVDPSHAAGKWWMVESLAKAAVAAGADGLMIEVHNDPEQALSDGAQSLKIDRFTCLMQEIKELAKWMKREWQE